MHKIKLIVYYLIITKLPNSRYGNIFRKIRNWYVCDILKIMQKDDGNFFEENVYIGNAKNISIGKHCHINENVFIQGATIGNFVMIAPNVAILNGTHKFDRVDVPMIMQGEEKELNPIIEDDVWIGRNAAVMPNIRIGRGSIIGAGAVVTKDVEPFSIMGGVPAKLIKKRR
ncbi:MAG: CatB-related O-acetyltransferase [Sulfurovum sp.]|nr:CatB-related O-acetyltransferase [Sulfurovum sp.]